MENSFWQYSSTLLPLQDISAASRVTELENESVGGLEGDTCITTLTHSNPSTSDQLLGNPKKKRYRNQLRF